MNPTHARPTAFLTLLFCLAASTHAAALDLPAGAREAAARITPAVLRAPIAFLADDLLEGRGPATRGDRLTRLYIASQLEAQGLRTRRPGGHLGTTLRHRRHLRQGPGGVELQQGRSPSRPRLVLGLHRRQRRAATRRPASTNAEVVFVGYGIQAPEYQWDDFKGADLQGKVLLMLNNDPDWDDSLFAGKRRLYYGRWTYKYESAARQGAAAAIIVHTTPSAGYPWQVVQTSLGRRAVRAAGRERAAHARSRAWATEEASAPTARRSPARSSTTSSPPRIGATSGRCRSA